MGKEFLAMLGLSVTSVGAVIQGIDAYAHEETFFAHIFFTAAMFAALCALGFTAAVGIKIAGNIKAERAEKED